MSQSQKVGLGIVTALIIAFTLGSGRVVLGQKEANPPQTERGVVGEARKFVGLTDGEREIIDEIGKKVAYLEELNLICETLKRKLRRYTDLQIDIEFQLEATPPGLSARELEEQRKNFTNRITKIKLDEHDVHADLRTLQALLAKQEIELHLLVKKNGLPNPFSPQTADASLEAIERSLRAIEARLAQPAANAR